MAKRIVDEVLNYTIIINGGKGQKELYELEKATRKLRDANIDLREEQAKLKKAGKENTEEYKKLTAEIKANTATITANEASLSKLQSELGANSLTMAQLTKRASELRLALRNMVPGSADYKRYEGELSKVNNRLRELRAGAMDTGFSMNKLADEFNRYQTLGFAVIAMVTSMGMAFGKLIGYNKDLEDQLANVRKTTGLNDAQVRELSQTLGTIDTRTSRMELLKLAEEAGRLDKESSEDILGFARVADKLFVALGDDFGAGAEHAIRSVGKLTELFEIGQREGVGFEQAMEMLGSSINEVAASGATQASYLVDFLNRTAGIGRQARISAQDFIGFAATLDEGAQSVEVSGTVMSNLISKMFKKTEEFAKAANIPLETFKALLAKDVNEALLQFLQGVNRNQGGLQELVENMDGLGIDGQRATSVLGLLASSVDKVREKQALANDALQEGTSLQDEFTVKNENMAGNLEKIRKRLAAAFSFKGLNDALREASHWLAVFVGAIEDSSSKALKWRETILFAAKAIGVAVVGLVSYKAAVALATLWTTKLSAQLSLNTLAAKANAIGVRIADAAIHLFAAGQALLTGNITAATFAWRGFTTALAANPIGLLVTGITVAVTAFYAFRKEQEKVVSNSEKIQDSYKKELSSIAQSKAAINARLEVIKKANLTDEQRGKAIAKLRSEYKEYVPLIKDESVTLKDIEGLQRRINARMGERMKLIREEMLVATFEGEIKRFAQERFELEENLYDLEIERQKLWEKRQSTDPTKQQMEQDEKLYQLSKAINEQAIAELDKNEKAFLAKYEAVATKLESLTKSTTSDPLTESHEASETGTSESSEKEKANEAIKRLEALRNRIQELQREMELDRMEANERELAQIRDKYAKLLEEAKGHASETQQLIVMQDEELRLKQLEQQAKSEAERIKKEEETQQEIQRIREQYGIISKQEKYDAELAALQSHLDSNLITYEEYLKGLQHLDEKYEKVSTASFGTERIELVAQAFGTLTASVNNLMRMEMERNEVVRKAGESEKDFTARKREEEQKRYQIEKKYANIRMLTTIGEIISQTALAVMKAAPIVPLQVLMAVLGATQLGVAVAERQKIQGYEEGLYPVQDQKGRNFKAGLLRNAPTGKLLQPTILAGEKPEIIIDPLTTRHLEMNYPQVIDAIYSSAARVRGYESGRYPERSASTGADAEVQHQLVAMLARVVQTQDELRETLAHGIGAYYDDAQVRQIRSRLEVNNQVQNARTL